MAEVAEVPDPIAPEDRPLLAERRRQLEEALSATYPDVRLPERMSDEEAVDGVSLGLPLDASERQGLLEAEGPIARALRLIRRIRGGPPSSL